MADEMVPVSTVCSSDPGATAIEEVEMPDTDDELAFPSYAEGCSRSQIEHDAHRDATMDMCANYYAPAPAGTCTALMPVVYMLPGFVMPLAPVPMATHGAEYRSGPMWPSRTRQAIDSDAAGHAEWQALLDGMAAAVSFDRRTDRMRAAAAAVDGMSPPRRPWQRAQVLRAEDSEDDSSMPDLVSSSSDYGGGSLESFSDGGTSTCSSDDEADGNYCLFTTFKAEHDGVCSICLDAFADDQCICTLSLCAHQFHRECLDKWLTRRSKCPNCRRRVTRS